MQGTGDVVDRPIEMSVSEWYESRVGLMPMLICPFSCKCTNLIATDPNNLDPIATTD